MASIDETLFLSLAENPIVEEVGARKKCFRFFDMPKRCKTLAFGLMDPFEQIAFSTHKATREAVLPDFLEKSQNNDDLEIVTVNFLEKEQLIEIKSKLYPNSKWIIELQNLPLLEQNLSGMYNYHTLASLPVWAQIENQTKNVNGQVEIEHTLQLMPVHSLKGMEAVFDLCCAICTKPRTQLQVNYDRDVQKVDGIMEVFTKKDAVVDYCFTSTRKDNRSVKAVLSRVTHPKEIVIRSLAAHDSPLHFVLKDFNNLDNFINCCSTGMQLDEIMNIPAAAVVLHRTSLAFSDLEMMLSIWKTGINPKWSVLQLGVSDEEYIDFDSLIAKEKAIKLPVKMIDSNPQLDAIQIEVYDFPGVCIRSSVAERTSMFIFTGWFFGKKWVRFIREPRGGTKELPIIHKWLDLASARHMFWSYM